MTKETLAKKHKCPVCGKTEFEKHGSLDICSVCGWQDDLVQEENPDEAECANDMSLNKYKAAYESGWRPEWIKEETDEGGDTDAKAAG